MQLRPPPRCIRKAHPFTFPHYNEKPSLENNDGQLPVRSSPHVPPGFSLEDPPLRPPLHHEVFVTGCYTLFNEDLAIAKLTLLVHKDDFKPLAKELKVFFDEVHQVSVTEILPCPLGDAYVHFGSPLVRERFLGPTFTFGCYQLHFVKHDEAKKCLIF